MKDYIPVLRRRADLLLTVFVLLAVALLVRAAFVTIGTSNRLQTNLALMNRTPQSFLDLGAQVETLSEMTAEIDQHSLAEIKSALITTSRLAAYAQVESRAQYDAWLAIKNASVQDKKVFLQLRNQLDEVRRFQDTEIVRLKKLLDDSTKPSLLADGMNLMFSFVVGVLSSILASRLYEPWKARKAKREQDTNQLP